MFSFLIRYIKEEKSQISAEMIIIVAILITMAFLVLNSLQSSMQASNETLQNRTQTLLNKLKQYE